jgi:uncharacterized protein GlcG (DUF336 family)
VWDVTTLPTASVTQEQIGLAVSKAGTAAFLSSDQEALTSRSAGFIIQQHFPPGVENKPPGPLVGVGFSNLPFSDINKFKRRGSRIFFNSSPGVGLLPVPHSSLDGSPGGLPLYKNGHLVGALGVTLGPVHDANGAIIGGSEDLQVIQTYDVNEDVALAGQFGFHPIDTIRAKHVFIDGISVADVNSSTIVSPTPAPIGYALPGYSLVGGAPAFPYPVINLGGVVGQLRQPIKSDPVPGLINGQPRLTAAEVSLILSRSATRAAHTRAGIRLPPGQPAAVFITVVNNPNDPHKAPTVLGTFRTSDATIFSWDVAVQKARTVIYFTTHPMIFPVPVAFSTRAVGFLAQSLYPPGIVGTGPGPFNGFQEAFSTANPATPLVPPEPSLPNGITIFPGGFPLYRNGILIGAIGVSGDGVDQDDIVSADGDVPFVAPAFLRADQFTFLGARLPYAKFPRNPAL